MTRYNYLLLVIMFFAWVGMSSFFPYLVPMLRGHFAIETSRVGMIMAAGVVGGSSLSFILSLNVSHSNEKNLLIISLFCFAVSVFSMMFPNALGAKYLVVIWLVLFVTLYRFAAGIYFNSSRALQISALADESARLDLLAQMKIVNSVAFAIGPLIGQWAIDNCGDCGFLWPAGAIFFVSFFALWLSPAARTPSCSNRGTAEQANGSRRNLSYYFVCIGAMFHFVFEAQIYAFITMKLVQAGHQAWVGTLFTANALTLITVGTILARFSDFMKENVSVIVAGSFCSLIAVLLATQSFSYTSVILISCLFSVGEFVTPQLTLHLMTRTGQYQLKNVAIYNFFTSAIGLGLGFYLGGALADIGNTIVVVIAWSTVFAFVILFLMMAKRIAEVTP